MNGTITDVPGILVGHATDESGLTGCTVVLCLEGGVGGVDQRGGAPGTRETDLLRPLHLVDKVNGILLGGGSAFGLAAADGVMRYLFERGIGFAAGPVRVPIVPAAILFDLAIGKPDAWPNSEMGYTACLVAAGGRVTEGNVGAGTGCSVGKILGPAQATKSGIGSASVDLGDGLVVGALMAVNAFGDVVDSQGRILAGTRLLQNYAGPDARQPGTGKDTIFADSMAVLRSSTAKLAMEAGGATVIGVVATNALLDKEETNKMAQMAQDGLARTVRPAHTMYDGDTLFALATGHIRANVTLIGAYAAEAVGQAIIRAVIMARAAGGLPASTDLLDQSLAWMLSA